MIANIQVDAKELTKALSDLQKSLIPAATARAINTVMLKAQADQIAASQKAFIIRRASYLKQSTKISKFSKPNDPSGQIGIIGPGGTTSTFEAFEQGGTKRALHGGLKAVPTDFIKPDKRKIIPAGKKPRMLKGAFRIGNKIFVEKGKGKNATIALAYVLKPSVRINNRLHFVERVTRIVEQEWSGTMESELSKAIADSGL